MADGSDETPRRDLYRFDEAVAARIITFLRTGSFVETAAVAAGISKQTLYNWLKRGARGTDPRLKRFAAEVEQAIAESEVLMVGRVSAAAKEQWQAAAWHLERKFPDRWGRRERIDHASPPGEAVKLHVAASAMTTEDQRRELAALVALAKEQRGRDDDGALLETDTTDADDLSGVGDPDVS